MTGPNRSCLGIGLAVAALVLILGTFSASLTESLIAGYTRPDFWQTPDLNIPWLSSPTPTPTITNTPTPCPLPEGWLTYQLQPGITIDQLSNSYGFSIEMLELANCQPGQPFSESQIIFLPAYTVTPTRTFTPTPSETPVVCAHPNGWSPYIVGEGETAFSLSLKYNIRIVDLQKANCLEGNSDLNPGDEIYLPLPATSTPLPPTPTNTATPLPPTATATITPLILFTAPVQ